MRILPTLLTAILTVNSTMTLAIEIDETASIKDTPTSIQGINHIGISVKNLDKMLPFYLQATGFELIKQQKYQPSEQSDKLLGGKNIAYQVAILKAPNMLLELTEYSNNADKTIADMPVQGPGMTHTCYQSSVAKPGYDKFVDAGTRLLTRGDKPVDIGGYGVTYAYGYDPEGNMFELEQLDSKILAHSGYDSSWSDLGHEMWMSQVALVSHDMKKLMDFYQQVLAIKPYRKGSYANNTKLDQIANITDLSLSAGWFKLDDKSKVMEFWQYHNPKTAENQIKRAVTDLGYSFSLEVTDIQKEYKRLLALGVDFISEPQQVGEFWQVYARDIDSNIFALRQPVNKQSSYSLLNFSD